MTSARWFARSRALKLAVALCVVSALAFLLGQGVAAFRVTVTQARATPPQVIERVSGAQGTTPTPPAVPASGSSGTAASAHPLALSATQTRATPAGHVGYARGKDKPHAKHKGAAGDSSHGGPSYGGDASQPAQQQGGPGGGNSDGNGGGPGGGPGGHGK